MELLPRHADAAVGVEQGDVDGLFHLDPPDLQLDDAEVGKRAQQLSEAVDDDVVIVQQGERDLHLEACTRTGRCSTLGGLVGDQAAQRHQ